MSTDGHEQILESRQPLDATQLTACLTWPSGPLAHLTVVSETGSTNADLKAMLDSGVNLPHLSAHLADHQTSGRGRADRGWETPPGAAVTMSILIRPEVARSSFGWAPMLAGLAVVRALASLDVHARLKWPNDVVVEADGIDEISGWGRWRKVAGILCEAVGDAVIVGIGVNVSQEPEELPVPHAASMALAGAASLARGALFGRLVRELDAVVTAWEREPGTAHALVSRVCATVGQKVTVDVPGGAPVSGTVAGLSAEGGLMLDTASGEQRTLLAGDLRVRIGA